jgi:hypothetical protein
MDVRFPFLREMRVVAKRQSNNPKRRIAAAGTLSDADCALLTARAKYVGSALHKRAPADYDFHPPISPRPHKSLCDDLRPVPYAEARQLFEEGIARGLMSPVPAADTLPKYVWSVDADGEVYEAKLGNDGYHGYRLDCEDERSMRELVLRAWNRR